MDSEGHDPGEGRNHADPGTAVGRSANAGSGSTGGWAANPMSVDAATAARNVINQTGPTTVSSNNQTLGISNVIGMMGGKDMSRDSASELQAAGWGGESVSDTGQTVDNVMAVRNVDTFLSAALPLAASTVPAFRAVSFLGALASDTPTESKVKNILGGLAASKINSVAAKALGPEIGVALSAYNTAAPVARAFGADAPSVNLGGAVVSAAMKGTGQQGLQGGTTGSDGSGLSLYGGWATTPASAPAPAPAPAPASDAPSAEPTNVIDRATDMALNFNAEAFGRAMRDSAKRKWGGSNGFSN